jgi:hypothetical protein
VALEVRPPRAPAAVHHRGPGQHAAGAGADDAASPPNGTITAYNVYASDDGEDFTQIAGGTWGPSRATKIATWDPVRTRFLRLEATAGVQDLAAIGELNVIGNGPPPR